MKQKLFLVALLVTLFTSAPFALQAQSTSTGTTATPPTGKPTGTPPTGKPTGTPPSGAPKGPPPHGTKK